MSFQSIPPGVIEETPDGKRQRYWHDFFNYAGIHRTVWLYATPHPHLTDITVVTGLDAAAGTVDYATAAARADDSSQLEGHRSRIVGPGAVPSPWPSMRSRRSGASRAIS